jgi:hypothetical protein
MNHAMSILKQDSESLSDNRKQTSSFGNWFTLPYEKLGIIVLCDTALSDTVATQMIKNLSSDVANAFKDLPISPNSEIDRHKMETLGTLSPTLT